MQLYTAHYKQKDRVANLEPKAYKNSLIKAWHGNWFTIWLLRGFASWRPNLSTIIKSCLKNKFLRENYIISFTRIETILLGKHSSFVAVF